jgi:hypothetical protein
MLFGLKYLYPNSEDRPGYRVIAKKGTQYVSETFPENKLKEAKAFAKEVEERFDKIKNIVPSVTGKKLTVYNKFSQDIYGKNFNELKTQEEKNLVKTRYRQTGGKFRKTFQTDALTDLNQERIRRAFPDVKFEFTKGKKYGVIKDLKNGKRNPEFTAVRNFVNNNYKLSAKKSLLVSTQRDIAANFELPKGVKEWNFDVNKGGYLYGVPDTAGANKNLGARIKNFVNEPKPYKIAADFGTPEGWLLSQMNRAYESKQNPNFIPKRDLVNNKKKIVGFTDNQYGGGKTYYALKKYAKKFNGTMMTEHPDFKNTKKYIDIANKVKLAPNKVIKDLLIKGGVTDDRITLNNLLQYMVNEKGVEPTKRGLVLHHKGGAFANPTRDFQILNTAVNQNIRGVESAMRADPANITPKNIKFLKDAGASITIDGKTYGGGPKTAIGGFRQAEQFVESNLQKYGPKEFTNFKKYLTTLASKNTHNICPVVLGIKGEATGGPAGCAAEMTQALDNDPVGVATKAKDLKVEGGAVNRIKNAATAFLKFAGKGKTFAITAGVGAGAGALVKQFRNDEPDTYLSDENQMKAMLVDTFEEDTLGKAGIGGELAAAGLAVPGSAAVYRARRLPFKDRAAMGPVRAALGPAGKALSGFATPLGMALTTPINIARQIREGDSLEDIATNPFNYLAPAFAGRFTREATRGMNPQGILAKGLRLGMSPAAVRGVSKFFGLPGLALSLGYEGYDQYKKYKEGEGFLYNLLNKDE